jgi:hypothetical protein
MLLENESLLQRIFEYHTIVRWQRVYDLPAEVNNLTEKE